ncbi:sulfite exporter TauE/SafE family protein [Flavobacterium sp. J27]|uniref:sulfite exporter TauE/SafE family protein n=1 Tax=Flavobacterium sp. J27 TaxID=2060419 RepID=UPI00103218F8|nr:sulfite exporter TauE/SafE family protein [Flavobacterium sp. J27]
MLYTAIIFGLISSFHCIGMCGPIAMMLPIDRSNEAKKITQILVYHLGRLIAYSSLGLVFGILGKGFFLAGLQQQLSIIVGLFMIAIALLPEKTLARYNFSKPVYKIISKVKSNLGKQFKKKSYTSLLTIGLLNGYLPCGMVYVALFGALAMPNIEYSILYMLLYGLGTVPLMSVVVLLSNLLTNPIRNTIQKAIPILAVCIGILFIVRGLGLNIPYVSPSTMNLFVHAEANCH